MGRRSRSVCWLLAALATCASGCSASNDPRAHEFGTTSGEEEEVPEVVDSDDDGITDSDEGAPDEVDTDGDGTPDYLDDDSDDDGLSDAAESQDGDLESPPPDSDADGTPDFRDDDSDDNGVLDGVEGLDDIDSDGKADYVDPDNDGDGIADRIEIVGGGSDCDEDGELDAPGTADEPLDCDNDGVADYDSIDADGDGLSDAVESEGLAGNVDTDGDGFLDRNDLDSDNDGISDAVEAGDDDLATAAVDSEDDGVPDFRDPDSDDDGVSDKEENTLGLNPKKADSDGDGVTDLVEVAAGTDPMSPTDNPQAHGNFVFVVPYREPSTPSKDTLQFRTSVQYADVYFGFDTTASMDEELVAMRDPVAGVPAIVEALRCPASGEACLIDEDCGDSQICFQAQCIQDPLEGAGCIPDLWTGVGRFDEIDSFSNLVSLQADPVVTANGVPADTGVGAAEAPYQPPACVADGTNCENSNLNCSGTGVGCVGFRSDAIRIYVQVTDADDQCQYGSSVDRCATFTGPYAGAELMSAGIKFIGLYGTDDDEGLGSPESVAWLIGAASGSVDAGGQPFVYPAIDAAVVGQTVQAVQTIVRGVTLDVTIAATDEPNDAGDALQFIDYVEVNMSEMGGCSLVDPTADTNDDGRFDAFPELLPGTPVCWDVIPVAQNTTVPPGETPAVFEARLTVLGDGSPLDERTVYFLVPPKEAEIPNQPQ